MRFTEHQTLTEAFSLRSRELLATVGGLSVEWVDELWAAGWVDHLLVEADGIRGMSLKACMRGGSDRGRS